MLGPPRHEDAAAAGSCCVRRHSARPRYVPSARWRQRGSRRSRGAAHAAAWHLIIASRKAGTVVWMVDGSLSPSSSPARPMRASRRAEADEPQGGSIDRSGRQGRRFAAIAEGPSYPHQRAVLSSPRLRIRRPRPPTVMPAGA